MGERLFASEEDSGNVARQDSAVWGNRWNGARSYRPADVDDAPDEAPAGVARRLQGRVDRQLWQLARMEADPLLPAPAGLPELLETARRMRRDTESLLLLHGQDPDVRTVERRRLSEVLADAAAAAEEPRRVDVRSAPAATIAPSATTELLHVLAELIDHVTAVYPGARVDVAAEVESPGGIVVTVGADGAARHDPDGLGGRRALAAAERIARRSRSGIALRTPSAGAGGPVATVHCPGSVVVLEEPERAPMPWASESPRQEPPRQDLQRSDGSRQDVQWSDVPHTNGNGNGRAPAQPGAESGVPSDTARPGSFEADPFGAAASAADPFEVFPYGGERPDPLRPDAVRPDSVRSESGRPDSDLFGGDRFDSDRGGSDRVGPDRVRSDRFDADPFGLDPSPSLPPPGLPAPSLPPESSPSVSPSPGSRSPSSGLPMRKAQASPTPRRAGSAAPADPSPSIPPSIPPSMPPSTPPSSLEPSFSSASSSPVDELFGPLLDLAHDPADELVATPIFEAIASAWFREDGTEGGAAQEGAGSRNGVVTVDPPDWETPSDSEWRAAAARAARSEAEQSEPLPLTATGLPRRRPGNQLVPPPRSHGPGPEQGPSERVPDRVRERLSTYQRGLRQGRHRADPPPSDPGDPAAW